MRSTFSGLNTMVRGIFSNQLSLDTTGHNITNAGTEGFSRQAVNLAATRGIFQSSIYGNVLVGTGVDSMSIQRARNVYADKQFWAESATQNYYTAMQTNYAKVEAIFNDSDNSGVQHDLQAFYQSWSDLSVYASTASNRITTVEKGKILSDSIQTATAQLQEQINAEYDELRLNITTFNDITAQITVLNRNIMTLESTGASANDLRDQRDLLADQLAQFVNINVYEDDDGKYTIVSNGITLVSPTDNLHLRLSDPVANTRYGINDYTVEIVESGIIFQPQNGTFKGIMDAIGTDKTYIDDLANMAGFLLTHFNDQHRAGVGIDASGTSGLNFYGANTYSYTDKITGLTTTYNGVIYTWDEENSRVVMNLADKSTRIVDRDGVARASDAIPQEGDTVTIGYTLAHEGGALVELHYEGVEIINSLFEVASDLSATDGELKVAARNGKGATSFRVDSTAGAERQEITISDLNNTADGKNAVLVSTMFNLTQSGFEASENAAVRLDYTTGARVAPVRAIGTISLHSYYMGSMSRLGNNTESVNTKLEAQDDVVAQIVNWRSSTSGVDWNEELTNMLMFQKGYSACARCLTTMDEMLDRLINSTGMVGR